MNKAKKIPASPQSFSPHEVRISGGFWKKKMDVNRRETLPIVFQRCEETGRIDALRQTWKPGQPNQPHIFWDSDRVEAHPAVRQNAGRIALRRGPVVYCIESVDNGADWWNPEAKEGEASWGYGNRPKSIEEFYARFEGLCHVLLDNPRMFGYCYTQLTDVFQEQNGVVAFDRSLKFDMARLRAAQTAKAAIEA